MTVHPPHRPSDDEVRTALRVHGYPLPTQPAVVALRRPESPGAWNDLVGAFGGGVSYWAVGTTDPGLQPMRGTGRIPVNPRGVARVRPGYYPDFFYARYHGNGGANTSHPALRQCDGQFGTKSRPVPVERWQRAEGVWEPSPEVVGPYNLHRAKWSGDAAVVGDYSHGCIVVRNRVDHWNLLLTLGYPEHGPKTAADRALRWPLYLLDWSAYLAR